MSLDNWIAKPRIVKNKRIIGRITQYLFYGFIFLLILLCACSPITSRIRKEDIPQQNYSAQIGKTNKNTSLQHTQDHDFFLPIQTQKSQNADVINGVTTIDLLIVAFSLIFGMVFAFLSGRWKQNTSNKKRKKTTKKTPS